ncbi:MAG: sigma 54-interacting transcriptional regulator, partial [Myxococcota bacterium]
RLFDTLAREVLAWPPGAALLQERIRGALSRREMPTLSQRSERETLTARFARWFPEAELPGLLRALDPGLAGVPIMIQGEPGTGRSLAARYIHTFASHQDSDFIAVSCESARRPRDLFVQLAAPEHEFEYASVFLEDAHRLAPGLQHRVCDWIEFGLPREAGLGISAKRLRWIAAVGPPAEAVLLAPRLSQALAGLVLSLEPIRGRRDAIEHFAGETLHAWSEAREGTPRSLAPDALELLYAYPWPGNYRELDAVLTRSLSGAGSREIQASDLHFEASSAYPRREVAESESDPAPGASVAAPAVPEDSVAAALMRTDSRAASPMPSHPAPAPAVPGDKSWASILHAATEELESPLASIRALAELLPEYHADADFRDQFQNLVDSDLASIERTLREVRGIADLSQPKTEPVDIASLIDSLIDDNHATIESQRIRVRKELDRDSPMALGDPQLLERALAGIVRRAIEDLPKAGNLFVTSRSHADLQGSPSQLRILLRCEGAHRREDAEPELLEKRPLESSLEFVSAHAILAAMGGAFTFDAGNERETVMVIDLPAPAFA